MSEQSESATREFRAVTVNTVSISAGGAMFQKTSDLNLFTVTRNKIQTMRIKFTATIKQDFPFFIIGGMARRLYPKSKSYFFLNKNGSGSVTKFMMVEN